jgi:hypothetical protein
MQLQKAVLPFDLFVRGVGLGPQVRFIAYDPSAPHHARYKPDRGFLSPREQSLLRDTTLTINSFFGWDFNSCESLRQEGVFYPIDFANPCPDSQVTSLHYPFPWIVKANVRWSLYCAAVKKRMWRTLDWEPFYEVATRDVPYREKLSGYVAIANQRFETDRFEEFCARHLGQLDEVAWEFFGSESARNAVHEKVRHVFPAHEVDQFLDHFWSLIQAWREGEGNRPEPPLGDGAGADSSAALDAQPSVRTSTADAGPALGAVLRVDQGGGVPKPEDPRPRRAGTRKGSAKKQQPEGA